MQKAPEHSLQHTASDAALLISTFDWQGEGIDLSCAKVLDLACGTGRNGRWFLDKGAKVSFIDKDLSGLNMAESPLAADRIAQYQWNLEDGSAPSLPEQAFDILLVVNYLHRPLMAQIAAAVKPGGILVYETFTLHQAQIGRPRNPDFLLKEEELKTTFANWQPLHYFEGQLPVVGSTSTSFKAQLIAKKCP